MYFSDQILATRYDQNSETKFDFVERDVPDNEKFRQKDEEIAKRFKVHPDGYEDNLTLRDKIMHAQINLHIRRLVGIALGSTAAKIYADKYEHPDFVRQDTDIDVLLLAPHSRQNPPPFEWGVDWFVRPDGLAPTNGLASTWYDLSLKESAVTASTYQAGLYLPHPGTMEKIIRHSNEKTRRLREQEGKMIKTGDEIKDMVSLFHFGISLGNSFPLHRKSRRILLDKVRKIIDAMKETAALLKLPVDFAMSRSEASLISLPDQKFAVKMFGILYGMDKIYAALMENLLSQKKSFDYLRIPETQEAPWPVIADDDLEFKPL